MSKVNHAPLRGFHSKKCVFSLQIFLVSCFIMKNHRYPTRVCRWLQRKLFFVRSHPGFIVLLRGCELLFPFLSNLVRVCDTWGSQLFFLFVRNYFLWKLLSKLSSFWNQIWLCITENSIHFPAQSGVGKKSEWRLEWMRIQKLFAFAACLNS